MNETLPISDVIEAFGFPNLPNSWDWASVGEVGEVRLGRQRSPKHQSGKHPTRYIRAANITWDGIDLSDVLEMDFTPEERDVFRLQAGDVVLSEASGSPDEVGKPAIWNDELAECCFQNTVIRFRPRKGIDSEFALAVFLHFAQSGVFRQVSRGVGIYHLSATRFSSIPFPVPPLTEQRRIVTKIDELFSDLDTGVEALKRAQENLEHYRSAELKAAIEGRLTEEWREQHPHVEPASELLNRVLIERRRRWESEKLAEYARKGRKPPKNWGDKYPKPAKLDDAKLPHLPDRWVWTTLDSLTAISGGITKGQRHGTAVQLREIAYLSVANVQRGFLDLAEVKTILARPVDIERLLLKDADILFTEGGDRDKLGRGWVWENQIENCIHQNHVFRARPLLPEIQSRFLSHHGNTFGRDWFMRAATQSINLASINLAVLRHFPVPLAPAEEQAAIMKLLNEKLPNIEHTRGLIARALSQAARLRQGILKNAFSGKLVEQDPTDESASELLDRIRHEQEAKHESPRSPQRRTQGGRKTVTTDRKPIRNVVQNYPTGAAPATVFAAAGLDRENLNDVDVFYAELSELVAKRQVAIERPDSESVLIKPRSK